MAEVIEENGELVIRLSFREKIFALHGNPRAKTVDLIATTESENPWSKEVLRGVRAPGTGIPYVVLLGTMRFKGGKDFTAIYKRGPVRIYEFKAGEFKRWIVSI
ncbi:MAG: hypothetical protein ACOVKM_01830 [Candidatus Planktophila sp.]